MRGECPAKCLLEEWMSPDQQKSKVNTQQKLGARTGPKVLQFLRLLSTRCLVLAGDACLSLSFSCFFFPAQVTGDGSSMWYAGPYECVLQTVIGTHKAGRGRSGLQTQHTHMHTVKQEGGRVKKRQRTAVTKTSWEGEKIGDSMKHSKISIPPTSLLQKRPNKKK